MIRCVGPVMVYLPMIKSHIELIGSPMMPPMLRIKDTAIHSEHKLRCDSGSLAPSSIVAHLPLPSPPSTSIRHHSERTNRIPTLVSRYPGAPSLDHLVTTRLRTKPTSPSSCGLQITPIYNSGICSFSHSKVVQHYLRTIGSFHCS